MTAFHSEEVSTHIEKILKNYDDCQNWLRKPIEPEIISAVAQRYCEGNLRLEKRFDCLVPVIAAIQIKKKEKYEDYIIVKTKVKTSVASPVSLSQKQALKTKSKTKTKSKVIPKVTKKLKIIYKDVKKKVIKIRTVNVPIYFHAHIENCSLRGVKIKPVAPKLIASVEWNKFLKEMKNIEKDHDVRIYTEMTSVNYKAEQIDILKYPIDKNKDILEKHISLDRISGKVIWTKTETGEWSAGIEFVDSKKSKLLFEEIVDHMKKKSRNNTFSLFRNQRIGSKI